MHGDGSVFYTQPVIDIGIRKTGLASRLSNLVARQFELDGVVLASIEGGLQASKCEDPLAFYELASMSGYRAWKRGQDFNSWKQNPIQVLYWIGRPIRRHSVEYADHLDRLYAACYSQCQEYRDALAESLGSTLTHVGKHDPFDTILTVGEYITRLDRLRFGTLR